MSTSSGIGAVTFLLIAGALVAAVAVASWKSALVCLCLAIAFNLWAWRRAVMVPIPKEVLAKEKPAHRLVAGIALLMALFG